MEQGKTPARLDDGLSADTQKLASRFSRISSLCLLAIFILLLLIMLRAPEDRRAYFYETPPASLLIACVTVVGIVTAIQAIRFGKLGTRVNNCFSLALLILFALLFGCMIDWHIFWAYWGFRLQ